MTSAVPLFGLGDSDGNKPDTGLTSTNSAFVHTLVPNPQLVPNKPDGTAQELQTATGEALKMNTDLTAEQNELEGEAFALENKIEAAIIQTDPDMKQVIERMKHPSAGYNNDDEARYDKARREVRQNNADLKAASAQLAKKWEAFHYKLEAAMAKADSAVAPTLARAQAWKQARDAYAAQEVQSTNSPPFEGGFANDSGRPANLKKFPWPADDIKPQRSLLEEARKEALKANPDLAAEEKSIHDEEVAFKNDYDAATTKVDPTVAPIVAKVNAGESQLEELRREDAGRPRTSPPAGLLIATVTPDEWQKLREAKSAAVQVDPTLKQRGDQIRARRNALEAKLQEAMAKVDSNLAPVFKHEASVSAAMKVAEAETAREAIDVDALAARMKAHNDLYRGVRDRSLAAYAASAGPGTPNEDIKTLIRLSAYLWIWDDFYGEGLWQQFYLYQRDLAKAGVHDSLLQAVSAMNTVGYSETATGSDIQRLSDSLAGFSASAYPTEMKLFIIATSIRYLGRLIGNRREISDKVVSAQIELLLDQWGQNYRQLITKQLPHDILDDAGNYLLGGAREEDSLEAANAEIDRDFDRTDPKNPVRQSLDGAYYVLSAWNARGSGWANSVKPEQWAQFNVRLAKAQTILENAYAQYPAEGEIARSMLKVELGQGQGRERMELWFQRAIQANPDDYAAYRAKEWYLQPRWYGSLEDIVAFGQECVKTGNWSAKVPTILIRGISEASDLDPSLYTRPDIWPLVEKTYHDYLAKFPKSIYYRTAFAKHAFDGGHTEIAREQFRILGNDWNRSVLTVVQYAKIYTALNL
jgi:hypothetical protein